MPVFPPVWTGNSLEADSPRLQGLFGRCRAAEALVLGDVVHGLVRRRQYRAGQARLEEIRNLAKGESEPFNVVDLDMPAQPFPDRFDARSARARAFLLCLASLRPRSLSGGADLDPGPLLSLLGTDAVRLRVVQPRPARTGFQSGEPVVRGRRSCRTGVGRAGPAGRRGAKEAASDPRLPDRLHRSAAKR